MTSARETARQVAERANGRCEYCQMHQSLQGATFHGEHVIPHSRQPNRHHDIRLTISASEV